MANNDKDQGTIIVKIDQAITKAMKENNKLSKTKIMQNAQIQRKQYNEYFNGTIQRVDLAVLTRIMNTCGCKSITEVLEYIPSKDR